MTAIGRRRPACSNESMRVLARNIVAFGRGGQLKSYQHAYVGSVAGLGHHQGVAQVYRNSRHFGARDTPKLAWEQPLTANWDLRLYAGPSYLSRAAMPSGQALSAMPPR